MLIISIPECNYQNFILNVSTYIEILDIAFQPLRVSALHIELIFEKAAVEKNTTNPFTATCM